MNPIPLIFFAIGAAFIAIGVWQFRVNWPLWREGIETHAVISNVSNPYLGDARYEDQAGQSHLLEKCTPPRYGKFAEGDKRRLTYVASDPAKWSWGRKVDQRFMAFFSLGLIALGLASFVIGIFPPEEREKPAATVPYSGPR